MQKKNVYSKGRSLNENSNERRFAGVVILVVSFLIGSAAPVCAADFPPPAAATPDLLSPQPIATATPTFRVGVYVGALSEQALAVWPPLSCKGTFLCPWSITWLRVTSWTRMRSIHSIGSSVCRSTLRLKAASRNDSARTIRQNSA